MNSSVRKLKAFGCVCNLGLRELLLSSERRLHKFITWARRCLEDEVNGEAKHKIKASTVSQYVTARQSWHLFHDQYFPQKRGHKGQLLSKAAEAGEKEKGVITPKDKNPTLLEYLAQLQLY